MIGVIIVSHGDIAQEMLLTTQFIMNKADNMYAISVDPSKSVDNLRKEILETIKKADQGDGVLILTDMFGGTPSNVGLSFLEENKVEVITGVNLPILLKLCTHREGWKLGELAEFVKNYGQKNISIASEILKLNRK
ncbi:MAG TPA: PTS sugar transporter subunit IIA [bacterium]